MLIHIPHTHTSGTILNPFVKHLLKYAILYTHGFDNDHHPAFLVAVEKSTTIQEVVDHINAECVRQLCISPILDRMNAAGTFDRTFLEEAVLNYGDPNKTLCEYIHEYPLNIQSTLIETLCNIG